MSLQMGHTKDDNAAIDVRGVPAPPEQLIDAEDPTSEPVLVKCGVSAKLLAVDEDEMSVGDSDGPDTDGWYFRSFGPSGTIEWRWPVTALAPTGESSLRLTVRPALSQDPAAQIASPGQASYTTDVAMAGSTAQRVWYWFQTDYNLWKSAAGAIGVAVLTLLAWRSKVLGAWRARRAPTTGTPTA